MHKNLFTENKLACTILFEHHQPFVRRHAKNMPGPFVNRASLHCDLKFISFASRSRKNEKCNYVLACVSDVVMQSSRRDPRRRLGSLHVAGSLDNGKNRQKQGRHMTNSLHVVELKFCQSVGCAWRSSSRKSRKCERSSCANAQTRQYGSADVVYYAMKQNSTRLLGDFSMRWQYSTCVFLSTLWSTRGRSQRSQAHFLLVGIMCQV